MGEYNYISDNINCVETFAVSDIKYLDKTPDIRQIDGGLCGIPIHLNYIGDPNAPFYKSIKRMFDKVGMVVSPSIVESADIPNILDDDFRVNFDAYLNGRYYVEKVPPTMIHKELQVDRRTQFPDIVLKSGFMYYNCVAMAIYRIVKEVIGRTELHDMNVTVIGRGNVGAAVANIMMQYAATVCTVSRRGNPFTHTPDIVINTISQDDENLRLYTEYELQAGLIVDAGFSKSGKFDIVPRGDVSYVSPLDVGRICASEVARATYQKWYELKPKRTLLEQTILDFGGTLP